MAGAVINSYLLTISKQKQANGLISIDLTDSDLRRLIELITDPKTDDKEFSDALEILTNSSQINSSPPLSRTIRLIATSQDKEYEWAKDQPTKRAAILSTFKGDDLQSVGREILSSQRSEKSLVLAAITYAVRIDDEVATKGLELLVTSKDKQISSQAENALARIDPSDVVLQQKIDQSVTDNNLSLDEAGSSLELSLSFMKPARISFFGEDKDANIRLVSSSKLFINLIKNDYIFSIFRDFGRGVVDQPSIKSRKIPSVSYTISIDWISGVGQRIIDNVLNMRRIAIFRYWQW